MIRYMKILENQVPRGVRFDVLRQNQGQTVEVAWGGFGRAEHGPGDEFKRVHDRSIGPAAITYYRREAQS